LQNLHLIDEFAGDNQEVVILFVLMLKCRSSESNKETRNLLCL